MCIMAMAWNAHPRWRLVLAGNRDEFHGRPAAPLGEWPDRPGLLAGRDLRSGGTWLGVARAGRAAIVTNLRGHGGPDPDRASRGALVTDVLSGQGIHADPRADRHRAALDDFNPFNLVLVDRGEALFVTNRPAPTVTPLVAGLYGLSNGALDAPWPKTLALKAALLEWLTGAADDPRTLFPALRGETLPAAGLMPEAPSDIADEAAASPIFIRNPTYGTRCSTLVAVDRDGRGLIVERRFDAAGDETGETTLSFDWR